MGWRSELSVGDSPMKTRDSWFVWKIILIIASGFVTPFTTIADGGPADVSSYWAALTLPLLFVPWTLRLYLGKCDSSKHYLTASAVWQTNPFRRSSGPVPFFHLAGWVCLVGGAVGLPYAILCVSGADLSTHIFGLSAGAGILLGIVMMRRAACRQQGSIA